MKPIRVEARAQAELVEAIDYYRAQRAGLGDAFYAAVADCIDQIREAPERWATIGRTEARKCSLKRFPYEIVYRDLPDEIQVVAVAHQKRRPLYWQDRI